MMLGDNVEWQVLGHWTRLTDADMQRTVAAWPEQCRNVLDGETFASYIGMTAEEYAAYETGGLDAAKALNAAECC